MNETLLRKWSKAVHINQNDNHSWKCSLVQRLCRHTQKQWSYDAQNITLFPLHDKDAYRQATFHFLCYYFWCQGFLTVDGRSRECCITLPVHHASRCHCHSVMQLCYNMHRRVKFGIVSAASAWGVSAHLIHNFHGVHLNECLALRHDA